MEILKIIGDAYSGYLGYLINEITHPSWHNYFYWLIGISLFCWAIIGFAAVSNVVSHFFNEALASIGITNLAIITEKSLPYAVYFLILFVAKDFIQWNIHRLLHASPFLWEFHKVHHSVKEMGFAAHLRYHWMENVIYKVLQYIPLAMLGYGLSDFFAADIIALAIGHLNHSNVALPLGPLKYIINHAQMHLWHHAKEIPSKTGVNFGISLSVWDYLFGTVYYPETDGTTPLGFPGDEDFPKDFIHQELHH